MYGDSPTKVNLTFNYGEHDEKAAENKQEPLRAPELYQNPYSEIKSLTLPEGKLDPNALKYNDDKFPENGAADTFIGASLKVDMLKKYMQK